MSSLKISIIIPVYNAEDALFECVSSILQQTYKSLEIILVNDGSTDNSAQVCEELKNQDSRIIVINKENGGTSSARNAGIEVASGDYITFADNDDLWNSSVALEEIAAQLTNSGADVLLHDNFVLWQDTNELIEPKSTCKRKDIVDKTASEALAGIVGANVFSLYCVWSKVIKASLIKEHEIRFPNGMRNEDTYFCGELFLHAKSYDWYEKPFYIYKKGRAGAQTYGGIKYHLLSDMKEICLDFASKVENTIADEALKKALLSFIAFPFCVWMGQSKMLKDSRIKADTKIMKQYKYLLKNDLHPSVKLVRRVCSLVGFGLTSRLLSIYIKRNNHLS